MRDNGWKRAFLPVIGALLVLAMPMVTLAGRSNFPKTVRTSVNASGCPGTLTVNASWDSKGGPADFVQVYLFAWDSVNNTTVGSPTDNLNVPLATKSSATYAFTGVASGDYRVNVFVWNNNGKELGAYFGTTDGPTVTCP
jgi:hypothetical protein